MKTNVKTARRGFTLVELLVVIVIIASLASLSVPMIIRQKKKADQATAISNAGQLYYAFIGFDEEYGTFPDAVTQADVETNFPDATQTADTSSSNGYFRQFFIGGLVESEEIFYVKTGFTKKPDGVFTGVNCLEARENGFGYVMNGNKGLSTAGNSSRVMVVTPLQEATDKFNPDPFDKKAVALRADKSVSVLNINAAGDALLGGGKKLLDTGADTIWGTGVTPTIVKPLVGN
ncbi:type II secretion system protein [Akkermansiaceae bacterium]|nr:type II secretion system protein [Akkermansiaceae bacterium]